jgi:hypothetical protein
MQSEDDPGGAAGGFPSHYKQSSKKNRRPMENSAF